MSVAAVPAPMGEAPADLTPGRRLAAALAIALALASAANVWLGARAPELLQETDVRYVDEVGRRLSALPRPERVRLVLVGNSHTMAGLRPPDVAEALGLPTEAVFSMATLGATVRVQHGLLARHRGRLPGLRAIVVGLDEFLFTAAFDGIERYASRGSFGERWRLARHEPDVDARLSLSAVRLFPLMDLKAKLHEAWRADREAFARRLVGPLGPRDPEVRRWREAAWPWGAPPPWETMDRAGLAAFAGPRWRPDRMRARVAQFYPPDAQRRVAAGLRDLDDMLAWAGAEGLAWDVTTTAYEPGFAALLERRAGAAAAAWRRDVASFLAARGRSLPPGPPGLAGADFYDPDHLAPAGGRKAARWFAPRLAGGPVGRALAR